MSVPLEPGETVTTGTHRTVEQLRASNDSLSSDAVELRRENARLQGRLTRANKTIKLMEESLLSAEKTMRKRGNKI